MSSSLSNQGRTYLLPTDTRYKAMKTVKCPKLNNAPVKMDLGPRQAAPTSLGALIFEK